MHARNFVFFRPNFCRKRPPERITHFFPDLDPVIYQRTLAYTADDLRRLTTEVLTQNYPADRAFAEIVRPRETLIRYSAPRAILLDCHPNEGLQQLFDRFMR